MGDADDQHEDSAIGDGVDDHIVLAGMDAAEAALAFQLPCALPPGILRQKFQPTGYPFPDDVRQVQKFFFSPRREREAVSHGLEPQLGLDLFPGDGLLAGLLEFLESLSAFLCPVTVFHRLEQFEILLADQVDGFAAPAVDADAFAQVGDAVEGVRGILVVDAFSEVMGRTPTSCLTRTTRLSSTIIAFPGA